MVALNGTFAILTGAAQGLGLAIARAYAAQGMKLALMDVQADKLNALADELRAGGTDCLPIPVDLANADATQAAVDQALAAYGKPRVLVHNAALLKERSMLEVTFPQWQTEVNIILQAAFLLAKAVWQPMIAADSGSIVFVSSGSGIKGFVKEVAYCPAKHGQEGLMKVLAMEGQPFNIAVNTITPGAPINTPMSAENYSEELKQKWVDPALLAPAFVYLAGIDAHDVTGERLNAWELSQQHPLA
ncbi:MAG: SDR family oxidoreductase [Chloroflexi bacterium]|uniref:SDR family NAD(P)-dependent oxidoreductase n=1 Tax=Candidatus Flexifilum breve TaxID=3140694 RepID=UPI0031368AEB|nr:SDR family oxidoreductase [Chloroflexota bacterium]